MMEKRATLKKICTVIAVALGIYIFFKYIFTLVLPFLIALAIAFFLNYPIRILKKRTRLSPKLLSGVLVTTVIFLLGFIVFLAVNRLITEIGRLIASLNENSDRFVSDFFGFIDSIAKRLPFINAVGADLTDTVSEVVRGMLTEVTSHLPSIIANVISMLPHILLFAVIIILASYYFSADFENIKKTILSLLPSGAADALRSFKRRLTDTGVKYLKATLVMLFITYFELLVGFLMLGIPYAFTLSFLVATVDMLPIFGVGTVLVPWALWSALTGDTYTAIGLVIIFAVVTVVRQFIEPKIFSNGMGVSPLTTLFAMYIGFRLFSFTGLLLSPLAAVLILHALPENIAKKLGLKINGDGNANEIKKE